MGKRVLSCVLTVIVTLGAYAQNEFTDSERKVFEEHENEIISRSRIAGEDAHAELCMKYNVPKSQSEKLASMLVERERRKAVYDYIYPSSPRLRAQAKLSVDSVYQYHVDEILIPYNKMSGENITFLLRRRKAFRLDDAQYEYLMKHAVEMCHKMRKDRKADVWDEEMAVMRNTLGKKMFNSFLIQKNASVVTKRMKESWKKLRDAGLTEELDSVSDCARMYMFYMEQEKIKSVYKNFSTERKKRLAENDKQMPKAVKMYYALARKEREAKKSESEETKGLVW